MIRIIIWIACLVTALTGAAKATDGIASQYDRSSGSKVACGGKLNESAPAAAHRTLPCGTRVRIEKPAERALDHRHHQRPRSVYQIAPHRPHSERGACFGFQWARAGLCHARIALRLLLDLPGRVSLE